LFDTLTIALTVLYILSTFNTAQQSVRWTLGTAVLGDGVRDLQAFFLPRVFSAPKQSPRPPWRQ
jgi:hypothetical protein